MSTKTMNPTLGDLLKREYDPGDAYCREAVTVLSGQSIKIGDILGKVLAGAASTAFSGTGNGAITMDGTTPKLKGVQAGDYKAVCIEPATNAGLFAVYDPNGNYLGAHTVAGAAFANQIKFTIADGATDFVAGDTFTITIAAGSGKYKKSPDSGSATGDGSEVAKAVAIEDVDASAADKTGVVLVRGPATVVKSALLYDSSVDDNTKKANKRAEVVTLGIMIADAA